MNPHRMSWAVALISAAVLGFEVSLMRMLLVASWHHFASLVLGVALLGFGASGAFLAILRSRLLRDPSRALYWLLIGSSLAIPLCSTLAQHIPVEARFVPSLFWPQLGSWVAYWLVLGVPFLLGAAAIGLGLMTAGERLAGVYAANLLGSGAGSLLAPAAMLVLPPEWLPVAWGGIALLAAVPLSFPRQRFRAAMVPAAGLLLLAGTAFVPPEIRSDPYKYSAQVKRLVQQGSAERIASSYGPRGLLEVYRGNVFHDLPFLSATSTPPPVDVLLVDGHLAGSILRVTDSDHASVADDTLMAFPYSLAGPRPRVLLLGERGTLDIWLALRKQARSVRVVQANQQLFELLRGPLRATGGLVVDRSGVETTTAEPRLFLERDRDDFDVIQLVSLEGSAAGSGGTGGLAQDSLMTVEGLESGLRRLAPGGLLFVCRGIQSPPRDNLKILATAVEALKRLGAARPGEQLVVVRDYLAVCTILRAKPWRPAQIARLREAIARRQLTPVWFPGVTAPELNQPDQLPAAADGVGDAYHHACRRLLSESADDYLDGWPFYIRAATDDRPFFHDFCKLKSIGPLRDAFGDLWLTRAETAFIFLLATLALVALAGVAFTLLPVLALGEVRRSPGKASTAGYFTAIGLAYLLLEVLVLSRLSLSIGDPVQAAAIALSSFLVFSGMGSAAARRFETARPGRLRTITSSLALLGMLELLVLEWLPRLALTWPFAARCALAVSAIAPLAFLMGFPMPLGLRRLDRGAPRLVPWAWGTNGFASVVAAPLAVVLAMSWGFRVVGVTALACYLLAGWLFARIPERVQDAPVQPSRG